jgi:hypothetical protein
MDQPEDNKLLRFSLDLRALIEENKRFAVPELNQPLLTILKTLSQFEEPLIHSQIRYLLRHSLAIYSNYHAWGVPLCSRLLSQLRPVDHSSWIDHYAWCIICLKDAHLPPLRPNGLHAWFCSSTCRDAYETHYPNYFLSGMNTEYSLEDGLFLQSGCEIIDFTGKLILQPLWAVAIEIHSLLKCLNVNNDEVITRGLQFSPGIFISIAKLFQKYDKKNLRQDLVRFASLELICMLREVEIGRYWAKDILHRIMFLLLFRTDIIGKDLIGYGYDRTYLSFKSMIPLPYWNVYYYLKNLCQYCKSRDPIIAKWMKGSILSLHKPHRFASKLEDFLHRYFSHIYEVCTQVYSHDSDLQDILERVTDSLAKLSGIDGDERKLCIRCGNIALYCCECQLRARFCSPECHKAFRPEHYNHCTIIRAMRLARAVIAEESGGSNFGI